MTHKSERIYGELLKVIDTLIDKKKELQNTFVFKGFGNSNNQPYVSIDRAFDVGITYEYQWMPIEEAIERMKENGYIDINDFDL